jgi:ribosomal protein S18 acetylase RimI-like enzyme
MATKYPSSAQTGERGIALVRQIATDAGAIFRPFENADLGIDGLIELLNDEREPSGYCVLVQVKAGTSYIRNGRFFLDADKAHFETWARYGLPVAAIICDLTSKEARWVEVSRHLRSHPEAVDHGPYSVEAPATQPFSVASFSVFASRFGSNVTASTSIDVAPNLLIRPWQVSDTKPTKALLSTIAPDYPGFSTWLAHKLNDSKTSKKVVEIGGVIAAFSMWQKKDDRNVKLQTFIVGQSFRGTAIGQHLLYHEIRTWADDLELERVHVTVASSKADLIAYFASFGFRVEGFSPNRYPRPAAELILAKHFIRQVVHTSAELDQLIGDLCTRFWGVVGGKDTRFGVHQDHLAVPATLSPLSVKLNMKEASVSPRVVLVDAAKQVVLQHNDESLMRDFYPLRIHLKDKRYIVIPIYPQWAQAMLSTTGPGTELQLRIDNVYYCYPKLGALASGDLAIFYETKTGGGTGAALGSSVIQEVVTDRPATLFSRYSTLGIYTLADIQGHVNASGKAMAIKFTLFEPFKHPLRLKRIQQILANKATMQGLTPVKRDGFEAIRSEGLS